MRTARVLCAALIALSPVASVAQEFRASVPALSAFAAASTPAGAAASGRPELVSAALSAPFAGLSLSGVDVSALLLQIARAPEAPQAVQPALARVLSDAPETRLQGAQELAAVAAQTRAEADKIFDGGDAAELARIASTAILLDEPRARRVAALVSARETAERLQAGREDSSLAAAPSNEASGLKPHGEACAPGAKCPFAWLYGGNKGNAKIDGPAAKVEGLEPPRASGWFIKQFKQMAQSMMTYISSAANSPAVKSAGMVLLHPLPFLKIYAVTSPALVRQILGADAKKYSRSKFGELMLSRTFGHSILTAEGEEHRRIRQELQGAFKRLPVREHAPEMIDLAESQAARWKPGQTIDIAAEMHDLALKMFARSFFGIDPASAESGRLLGSMHNLIEMMGRLFLSIPFPAWIPTRINRDQKRVRAEVDAEIYGLIEDATARPNARPTLLDQLIAAEPMTPQRKEFIRDQLTALFFAGHETSANLLSWTFHLVAEHPRVEQKLRDELAHVVGDRRLVPADLDRLPYLKAVLMESMRLYPPGWLLDRAPVEDVVVGGFKIPKGTQVLLPLFLLSRSDYFDGPDDFVPERFLEAKLEGKEAFLPFGEGLHYCLGSLFALDSVQAAVATIMRRWRFSGTAQTVSGRFLSAKPSILIRIDEPAADRAGAISTDDVRAFVAPVARALAAYAGAAPIAQLGAPSLASFILEGDAFAARAAADPEVLRLLVEALRAENPGILPETLAAMPLPERLKTLETAAAAAGIQADADARAFLSEIGEGTISGRRAAALFGRVDRMWYADQEYMSPQVRERVGEVRARIRDIWEQRRLATNAFMTDIRQRIAADLMNETNTYVKTPEGWKIADFMPVPDYPTLEAAYTERLTDIAAAPAGPWHRPVLRTMEKFLQLDSTRKTILAESGAGALEKLVEKVHAAQELQRSPWRGAEPEKLEAALEKFRVYFDKGRLPKAENFVAMASYYDSLFTEHERTSTATKWRIASWLTKGNARDGFPTMDQYQTAWTAANFKLSGKWELGFFYIFPFTLLGAALAGSHYGMTHSFGNLLLMFFTPVLAGVLAVKLHIRRANRNAETIQSAGGDGAGFYVDDLRQKDDFMNFWKRHHPEFKPIPSTGGSLGMKGGLELNVESSPKSAIIAP